MLENAFSDVFKNVTIGLTICGILKVSLKTYSFFFNILKMLYKLVYNSTITNTSL